VLPSGSGANGWSGRIGRRPRPAGLGVQVPRFAGAACHQWPWAPLVPYGPYRFAGPLPAPSNVEFDRSLRARDPAWGIRDVVDLAAAAAAQGLVHTETVALPANNHVLVFRR